MSALNPLGGRCLIVSQQSREALLASGLSEGAVSEIEDFRAYLIAKGRGRIATHKQWKSRSPKWRNLFRTEPEGQR